MGGISITGATKRDFRAYTLSNYKEIPQIQNFTQEQQEDIEIAARIFPFRVNNYVIDELINWDNVPNDPMFKLTFPNTDMLLPPHYEEMKHLYTPVHRKMRSNRQYIRYA